MEESGREALEAEVRARLADGATRDAAAAAVRGYGPEIYGFLVATLRDGDAADEVFADFCETLVEKLPTFAWRSSLRTWAYAVARNGAATHARNERRRARREQQGSVAGELAAEVRERTKTYLRTEARDRFRALRATLPVEDQMLLVLRVDRDLAWRDVALVFLDGPADDDALAAESARLRKRFQAVKEKLRELGRQAGLIDDS